MGPCFKVPTSIGVIPSSLCDNPFESNPDLTSAYQSVRYRNFLEYHSTIYMCLVPELNYYTATMHAMPWTMSLQEVDSPCTDPGFRLNTK
jgi:hypothetical protein